MGSNEEPAAAVTSVVPLDPGRAAQAGAVLARAFHGDPIQMAIYPDPMRRAAIAPRAFAAAIRAALAAGGHVTTTADTAATAVWTPPGIEIGMIAKLCGYGLDLPRIMVRTPLRTMPAMVSFFVAVSRRRRVHAPEPHWYLAALGVEPARQGQGLGTLLVREGLDRADADRARAYLETGTAANVRFYRALGFEVVEELTTAFGVPLWLMARDPHPTARPGRPAAPGVCDEDRIPPSPGPGTPGA